MTQTSVGQIEDITDTVIERLVTATSPTTTILLSATRPGDRVGDKWQQLRSLIHELGLPSEPAWLSDCLSMLEELNSSGGPGIAIYASAAGIESIAAPVLHPRLSPGPNPLILPFLAHATSINEMLVLALSRKHLRLIHVRNSKAIELPIPIGAHRLLDQMAEHNGDANLGVPANRSELYFARLDFTLSSSLPADLAHIPVVLMGVHEEIAAFRRVSRHLNLLSQEIPQCGQHTHLGEIAQAAGACAQKSQHLLASVALTSITEHAGRGPVSHDPIIVLEAARQGRVLRVCLDTPPQNHGLVQPAEHLWNDIAVETLRYGGEVHILPPDAPPLRHGVAAQFRY